MKKRNCVFDMCMCFFFLSNKNNAILFKEREKERKNERENDKVVGL